MIYLKGQDDFFQTGNEPNGAGHLSQPYNKDLYIKRVHDISRYLS